MKVKGNNVLVNYLALLGLRYTESFANQTFNEHPHKNNLYGLSKMLSDYGIDNAATCLTDKEQNLAAIELPFIAQFANDFVAVYKVEPDKVHFIWKSKTHVLPVEKFIEAWTGIILLTESFETSIEPDYKEHRKKELINSFLKTFFFAAIGMTVILAYIIQYVIPLLPSSVLSTGVEATVIPYHQLIGISLLILISLAGMYISWLLLVKQMHIQSRYADKICSLFKQNDCNNVLESEAARLFGIIGWSEIGFGYFAANVLLLLFSPSFLPAVALINILTLPFTLWSVWYQRVKARQWCMLCVIVLVLLWSIFILNLIFSCLNFRDFFFYCQLSIINYQLIVAACCYFVLISGINLHVPKFNTEKTIQAIRQNLNSLKADEDVFITLLKKQPFYETDDCDSMIRFGNPDSKLQLTVLSNPYCNPCSKMHPRIEALLKKTDNNISVQYILSSFSELLNSTNKYLIAACLENKTGSVMQIFTDWFEKGKPLRDDYFKVFDLNMANPEIEAEFQKHESWKQNTRIRATPTILVNGYQLPESYKIEDLLNFTAFETVVVKL